MSHSLQAVREAAIDGRLHNIFIRREQLEALQRKLLEQADAIENAIRSDSGYAASEVAVEYLLTLKSLKEYHQSLNAERALKDEYAIARGEDDANRTVPIGIVYIVPTSYTPFYSIITAVAGAITAGNCVVIELPNTLHTVPPLVRELLESSLDRSIVAFVSTPATDKDLGPNHIRLDQNADSSSRTIAIVDQSADIASAAEMIVAAGFGFGCDSPYAPDVVFVNEFVKEAFLQALMQSAIAFPPNLSPLKTRDAHLPEEKMEENDADTHVVSRIGRAAIVEAHKLDLKSLANGGGSGHRLVVHTVRSQDHAIDLSNQIGNVRATYVFAHLKSAKYMTQFINSNVAFVNHIPIEVLVGPSAVKRVPFNRTVRYPPTLFTVPGPQYARPTICSQSMMNILRNGTPDAALQTALAQQSTELVLASNRDLGGGVGFFEQGILTGFGLFSATFVVSVATVGYWAWVAVTKSRS